MKGYGKEIVSIFFVAIVLYLLLSNGSQTSSLVNSVGGQISNAALVLQGRGGSSNGASTPGPAGGFG